MKDVHNMSINKIQICYAFNRRAVPLQLSPVIGHIRLWTPENNNSIY